MSEAYNKGYRYAILEYPRRYNPYDVGTQEYKDFNDGWDKSKEEWG